MGDVTALFTPRRRYRGTGIWNWQMRREVILVTGKGDYILSSDKDSFFKAGVQEARLHTDNRMVLAVLRGEGAPQNCRYIVGRKRWPLAVPMVRPNTEGGAEVASLKGEGERK